LILKSVAAVTAHSGFETATEISLNTLTDIVAENCLKFCKLLKTQMQQRPPNESVIDAFNQTYLRSYSENVLSLHEFWVSRVKNVALKLEKEDLELLEEYNSLKESSNRVSIKEEKP